MAGFRGREPHRAEIAIEGDAFDNGAWRGVSDTSTAAHGTYSLRDAFDCPYEVTWTAISE